MDLPKELSTSSISIGDYTNFIVYIVEGIVLFILIFYYFVPSYNEIQAKRTEIEEKEMKLADVTEYAAYLAELANATLALEEDIVNYAMPSENDVITLILTYEGLAQNEGILVSPIDLAPGVLEKKKKDLKEEETGMQQVDFSMTVKADDEEKASNLIDAATKTRRIFDIQSISWKKPEKSSDEKALELDISFSTYYYIQSPQNKSNRSLVKQGQKQKDFIAQLQTATVFEDLILEGIDLGKEDLFEKVSTQSSSGRRG